MRNSNNALNKLLENPPPENNGNIGEGYDIQYLPERLTSNDMSESHARTIATTTEGGTFERPNRSRSANSKDRVSNFQVPSKNLLPRKEVAK